MCTVRLRPIKLSDTQNIIKWRNSPSVLNNFINQNLLTEKDHKWWYNNRVLTGEVVQFIIYIEEYQQDIGTVFLRDIDYRNAKAEFGIFIGEESAKGKGYGTAATKLIIEHAFNILNLNKVMLRVFERNDFAIKSYLKNRFAIEGIFKEDVIINNMPENIVFMAVLKKDWMK